MSNDVPQFDSLTAFYPYYLGEHRNGTCRSLHLLGTSSVVAVAVATVLLANPWLLLLMPAVGYGPAWVGHFFFERNKPATFDFPAWSLACDWLMARDMLLGRIPIFGELPEACIRRFQLPEAS
jgi:hypothetical protein